MNKDTVKGVWQHLANAEALANGALLALQKRDERSEKDEVEMQRVGGLVAKISRNRRDWEYWFVPLPQSSSDVRLKQELLPFEKTWYPE